MKYYDSEIEVIRKSDESPVTVADLAANQLIVEALAELAPDTPILSEEQADHRLAPEVRCFWSVDPRQS